MVSYLVQVGFRDADCWKKLQLQDLRGEEAQSRITLNIRDQSRFFTHGQEDLLVFIIAGVHQLAQLCITLRREILIDLRTEGLKKHGKSSSCRTFAEKKRKVASL
jgi:transcription initiation factor TFIIH subunit 1